MKKPQAGQIYERNGKQREVVRLTCDGGDTFNLWWRRPGKTKEFMCWCSTWMEWASKAKLVQDATT